MRHDNPAVYECPRGKNALHTWQRNHDGTAHCVECGKHLTAEQTADCFWDRDTTAHAKERG